MKHTTLEPNQTMATAGATPDLDAIKARQQATWGSVDSPGERDAIDAFTDKRRARGCWVYANGLAEPNSATVADRCGEEPMVTDGSFLESKELLAGFWIVETAAKLVSGGVRACSWNSVLGAVLFIAWVGTATPARAQVTVSPSGGISGEAQPIVGVAVGTSLGVVRPELELAWARRGIDRRAATPSEPHATVPGAGGPDYLPAVMADVSTLMFRVGVPLRQGRTFESFGSAGVGLARATRQPPPGESLQRTDTQAGIEVGGGTTIWLSSRIGLRTAATYFKVFGPNGNFHGAPGSGLVYTNLLRDFSLTRVTVGLDIRLSRSSSSRP